MAKDSAPTISAELQKLLADTKPWERFNDYRAGKGKNKPKLLWGMDAKNYDFNKFDLSNLNLTGVKNIESAKGLHKANLTGTTLTKDQIQKLLKYQSDAFNKLREDNPNLVIDLTGLDAQYLDFSNVNLNNIDMSGVKNVTQLNTQQLQGTTLTDAQLGALLNNQNTRAFNTYRKLNPEKPICLSGDVRSRISYPHELNLSNCDLTGVSNIVNFLQGFRSDALQKLDLKGTKLSNQQLSELTELPAIFAHFREQNPKVKIDLSGFDFKGKDLRGDYRNIDFTSALNIEHASSFSERLNLEGATLSNAQLIAILESGKNDAHRVFNAYREGNPSVDIDLSGLDRAKINREHEWYKLDFRNLDLRNTTNSNYDRDGISNAATDLGNDHLTGTILSNEQLVKMLLIGDVSSYSAYISQNPKFLLNLSGVKGRDLNLKQNKKEHGDNVKTIYFNLDGVDLSGVVGLEDTKHLDQCSLKNAKISDKQLITFLEKGLQSTFNSYRNQNKDALIDLNQLDAEGLDLGKIDFSDVDLRMVKNLHLASNLNTTILKNALITPEQVAAIHAAHGFAPHGYREAGAGARVQTPSPIITDMTIEQALSNDRRVMRGK